MHRRTFLKASTGGALLLGVACAPSARGRRADRRHRPSAAGPPRSRLPAPRTFRRIRASSPDYHVDDPRFDDGFDNYPANPIKAVTEKPGTAAPINILNRAYFPPPTPFDQNPTWQEVNRQINANMAINVIAGPDYQTKFVTTMAGDDLPDIMHIYNGYALAPNLQAFFKAKCADLTPYLAGDAAKDYPYLAAIPTYAWKNSVSAIDGALYLVPIQRHLPTFPGFGGYFFANTDMWNSEIGEGYTPKDADDFKRILVALTKPQENRWGIGNQGTAQLRERRRALRRVDLRRDVRRAAQLEDRRVWQAHPQSRDRGVQGGRRLPARPDGRRRIPARRGDAAAIASATRAGPVRGRGRRLRQRLESTSGGRACSSATTSRCSSRSPRPRGGKPQAFLSHGFISMNVLKKARRSASRSCCAS